MLIKHHRSHLTQGSGFPFRNTIMGRRIRTRKLVFKAQVMAKCLKMRVSEFRAIVTADRSYGISVPLVRQPQDKISNESKRLPFRLKKEHPRIPRVIVHHNKDVPLPTRGSPSSSLLLELEVEYAELESTSLAPTIARALPRLSFFLDHHLSLCLPLCLCLWSRLERYLSSVFDLCL
jgi:hypothetical protein